MINVINYTTKLVFLNPRSIYFIYVFIDENRISILLNCINRNTQLKIWVVLDSSPTTHQQSKFLFSFLLNTPQLLIDFIMLLPLILVVFR